MVSGRGKPASQGIDLAWKREGYLIKKPGDVKEITLVLDVLENVFMDTTKEIFS